jgi:antitoxin MazE
MKAQLIKIGNSRGIRLPKSIIEQVGLEKDVELEVEGDRIVIRSASDPRAGWEEACREMAARGDDALIDGPLPSLTRFDEEEWEW